MRQIIFPDFDLIISDDVRDIFKWFGVNSLCGVTYAEATFMNQFQEGFCSMVDHHPEDKEKSLERRPFMYLNTTKLMDLEITLAVLIIQNTSFKLSYLMSDKDSSLDEVYSHSENVSVQILDKLKFPKVFHRL
tara:strand:- start:7706 stop:8104 length:399 start_codon:yes stop_codon:yes gene_type:complete